MTDARHHVHATSFGAAAQEYERGRPGYPEQAVRWVLPEAPRRVLDLGAGTGKLTRTLVDVSAAGPAFDVVAVDPLPGMREGFAAALPDVRILAGSGEAIPLPDDSVDAVLAGQAWHWVDPERAVPEVARILRPGGRLGLLWNVRDETSDWVAALGGILQDVGGHVTDDGGDPPVGPPFGSPELLEVPWVQRLDRAGVLDLVRSRSYFIVAREAEQRRVLAEVERLLDSHPDLAGRDTVDLPYVTQSWRYPLS
ncbi:class I SAM-dependent methyltransferase [Nakamurella endophytica]|uniref:Methyltransferase n=1 Tax=Nakamurella endophytica TaxID=1748367 RepID=A0A917T4T8_9ACTN|nr:class I SAM-dependent methyltransferase [Nakamurella endophytica]GGM11187.1 putative methyltransferase [Nakamurella endophytica]